MRPADRPTHVPLQPGADLSHLATAKIIAAPEDPADRPAWRAALTRWRDQAGPAPAARYPVWTGGCFSVCVAWLWDEALYDAERGVFTPDEFLRHGVREFGGYDAVVLWHAYPVIGLDGRDQFRFYRDVPGITELVAALSRRGVRVLLDYNPWAAGGEPHAEALATLVGDPATPGVLRTSWFERRHMLHHTRRWHRDHSELHSAWLTSSPSEGGDSNPILYTEEGTG